MRVHETAGLFPESVLLLQAVIADLHSFGRLVDTFAVLEKRNHQFAKGEFTGMELGLFPGLDGIEDGELLVLTEGLFFKTDNICLDLVFGLIVDTVDLLVAGIGDLFGVLGQLDLGDEIAVVVLDSSQLVDARPGRWKRR